MIRFNTPTLTGIEQEYLQAVFARKKFSGSGEFAERCGTILEELTGGVRCLLTTSCTHALEMTAMLLDIEPGDEVILPSYAFTSTATAFVRCGARLVFIDVDPVTMNLDARLLEEAITPKSKGVVALHYAGVSCDMDPILEIANRRGLKVVEDAAQAILSTYKGRACGNLADAGCFSFHETKNVHCGEGGALVLPSEKFVERAEVILEKGTNRMGFFRGEVEKYTWVGEGSSYVLSELNAAFLYAQLERVREITEDRLKTWNWYAEGLAPLAEEGLIELPNIPDYAEHNGHIYFVKLADEVERGQLIAHLAERGIKSVFHYVPLHSSPAGRKHGQFFGEDRWTTRESGRLLRLPLYYGMREEERAAVVSAIFDFFGREE